MQHLYYADILLEEGEIRAEEIWGIFEKAPRFPQVVFFDFRETYYCLLGNYHSLLTFTWYLFGFSL